MARQTLIQPEKVRLSIPLLTFASCVLTVACFTAVGVWRLAGAVNQFSTKLDNISSAVPQFWTVSDQVEWAYQTQEAGRRAGIVLYVAPDPREIVRKRVPAVHSAP